MDRIEKALHKLSRDEQEAVKHVLLQIASGRLVGLDFQKLRGHRDLYRIRKGRIRVIFRKRSDGGYSILTIERRSDTTYRDY